MAELCSFCWKFIFSKVSYSSHDIIQNSSLEIKQMSDYCLRRVEAVSQDGVFFLADGRYLKFFWKFWPYFSSFFCKYKNNFFFKICPGSLSNTFLHKSCEFKQAFWKTFWKLTSSKNYITPRFLDIFTLKLYGSFFNKYSKQPKKSLISLLVSSEKWLNFPIFLPFKWVCLLK